MYMPSLKLTEKQSKDPKIKAFVRQTYHDILRIVTRPIRNAQREGGFVAMQDGVLRICRPAICAIINDNPEGQLLAGVYGSMKAQLPCRMCM